jgi:hypothetical protein
MYPEVDSRKKFVVFAIEEYRNRRKIDGKTAIELFEKSGLLQYIDDFYDVLHSYGAEYLVADFDDYLKNRNMDGYDLSEAEKTVWRQIAADAGL